MVELNTGVRKPSQDCAARALPHTNRNHHAPPGEAANMIHGNIRLSGLRATTLLNHLLGLRQRPNNQEMSSAFWAVVVGGIFIFVMVETCTRHAG